MTGDLETERTQNGKPANTYSARVQTELTKELYASAVVIFEALIEEAFHARASDIHIDPTVDALVVRFRIDGVLSIAHVIAKTHQAQLLSRIKILCGLRTDEHAAAQDGRLRHCCDDGSEIDIRVSIMPLYYGENVVMRLLFGGQKTFSLATLGFTPENQHKILTAVKQPYGMILATGPTGSGKTTTLYTLLSLQDAVETAIMTIEDPIEYAITGVNQIQVNPRTGLTFAHGLRSMLRQDPNTIMVGEIRDNETAGLAVNIALTGHVVVSTLHTNDAATTLPRLLDMKIEPYLIASTVTIAIGQRLVRRLCTECRLERVVTPGEVATINECLGENKVTVTTKIWTSVGCLACRYHGYHGRVGIHEVLVMSPRLRESVLERASAETLRELAIRDGMVPLIIDGLNKALTGVTTIEEVLKIHYE